MGGYDPHKDSSTKIALECLQQGHACVPTATATKSNLSLFHLQNGITRTTHYGVLPSESEDISGVESWEFCWFSIFRGRDGDLFNFKRKDCTVTFPRPPAKEDGCLGSQHSVENAEALVKQHQRDEGKGATEQTPFAQVRQELD